MAGHTRGPWQGRVVTDEPNRSTVLGPDGNWLLAILHNGEAMPAKQEADLAVVAAGPDLLEALKAFRAHYPMGVNPFLDDAYRAAGAAIAKAGGVQ